MLKRTALLVCLVATISCFTAGVPTAVFAGMGDSCENPGMKQIT